MIQGQTHTKMRLSGAANRAKSTPKPTATSPPGTPGLVEADLGDACSDAGRKGTSCTSSEIFRTKFR